MSNIFLSIVFYKLNTNLVIYEVDPLCCPNCGGEMRIISFLTEHSVIRQILEYLGSTLDCGGEKVFPVTRPNKNPCRRSSVNHLMTDGRVMRSPVS